MTHYPQPLEDSHLKYSLFFYIGRLLPAMAIIMYDTLASQPVVKYIRPVTLGMNKLANELINYPWEALR